MEFRVSKTCVMAATSRDHVKFPPTVSDTTPHINPSRHTTMTNSTLGYPHHGI